MPSRLFGPPRLTLDGEPLLKIGLYVINEFHRLKSNFGEAINRLRSVQKPKGPIFCEYEPADIRKFREAGYRARKAQEID